MKNLPDDMRVLVDGYEGGLDDPVMSPVVEVDVYPSDTRGVYGPHALKGDGYWQRGEKTVETVRAVILTRNPPKGDR